VQKTCYPSSGQALFRANFQIERQSSSENPAWTFKNKERLYGTQKTYPETQYYIPQNKHSKKEWY